MNFSVYKSSAGSGKTYTLVKEYLKLVLKNPELYRNILAITFTNKASSEMKERILVNLLQISTLSYQNHNKIEDLIKIIANETNLNKDIIIKNASQVLENILHNYADFSVGTIDSFMHKVIKSFAFELGVPHSFNVEMDQELVTLAVNMLLTKVGIDKSITKILVKFMEKQMDEEKKWDITQNIISTSAILLNDASVEPMRQIMQLDAAYFLKLIKELRIYIDGVDNNVNKIVENIINIIKSKGLSHESFELKSRGTYKYFENILNKGFIAIIPHSKQIEIFESSVYAHKSATASEKEAIKSITADIDKAYHLLKSIYEKENDKYNILSIAYKNIYSLALLNNVFELMEEIKSQLSVVHISDFNKKIFKIVVNEPIPFIYERIGEKYKHFLLDEFQDTNILQWQNLLPLLENSLSNGNFNLIVGDGKQAIYRWRGGEVEQFVSLPKAPAAIADSLALQRYKLLEMFFKPEMLNSNYRSKAEIVQFNNDFFEIIKPKLPDFVREIYNNHQQNFNLKNDGGFVSIDFIDKNEDDLTDEYNQKIIDIIESLEADKYRWKDICVLCRSNSNASSVAINLLENGYDVVSEESLLLSKSPEVNFVFALLKYFSNPDYDLPKAEIILYLKEKFPLNISEDLNTLLSVINVSADSNINKQNRQCSLFNKSFEDFLEEKYSGIGKLVKESMNLYDLCERLIKICEFNNPANPYIIYFLESVLDFQLNQSSNLNSFIDWWSEKSAKTSIQVPQNINAIKVMTIHKSKGLDFPVVIFPFAHDLIRINNKYDFLQVELNDFPELKTILFNSYKSLEGTPYESLYKDEQIKSVLDVVNLMYVAFTRPRERLYVISHLSEKDKQENIDDVKSIAHFLKYYLVSKNIWNVNKMNYSFGYDNICKANINLNETNVNAIVLERLETNLWMDKLLIKNELNNLWKISKTEAQLQWGSLIHNILAELRHGDDLEKLLYKLNLQCFITNEERIRIYEILSSLINHPRLAKYFFYNDNDYIKTEAEIISSDGKVYRPDRFGFVNNKAYLIDFKTGKHNKHNENQIIHYAKLLQELGVEEVEKLLVYIESTEIMEVNN